MAAVTVDAEPGLSDDTLVERLRAGDRDAFNLLYERYFHRIYRFVDKRMRIRADTDEAVQEVFINVFSSIHTYRGEAPFAAWVFGLTRRTVAARFKRKRHETIPLSEDGEEPRTAQQRMPGPESPLDSYECSERLRRIQHAARQDLTDEQRRLFELHHLEDHSIQEIAQAFEKSENSVKSHLYRARRLLLAR